MFADVRRHLLVLFVLAVGLSPLSASGQQRAREKAATSATRPTPTPPKQPDAEGLPPMSWTCPMDPDIIEDKAGKCPKCKMALVATRLDEGFSCPVHPQIIEAEPGKCRICKRDLVGITVSIYWLCAGSDERQLTPGGCPDGSPRKLVRERRAHGDHNPRHGGQFFMASDNWHHVEGTYPRPGVFRLFVYDDFTRPIAPRKVTARAVTKENFDAATRTTNEIEQYQLRPAKSGKYLETRISGNTLPQAVTAKIKFDDTGQEYRFDFNFSAYTKEPPPGTPPPNPMMASTAPATTPPASGAASSPTVSGGGPASLVVSFGTVIETLPTTTEGLVRELTARNAEVGKLLDDGEYAQLYVPALAAKEVAVALTDRVGELPEGRRPAALSAAKRIVLAAWQIDYYGDLGDKQKLTDAYRTFAAAATELSTAYGPAR